MGDLAERNEPQAVATSQAPTPAHMLQTALEQGMTPEMIEKFMGLEERHRKNEAKKAYDAAVAAFHEHPPHVSKDRENKQYKSWYTSLGNLVNTVSEALGKHGLHASWKIEQPDGQVQVTCILAHTLGHSESVTMQAPPDTSGQKNPIQQIKSTVTYLRGATFEAVTGIASDDETGVNKSDDGNAAGTAFITEDQAAEIKAELKATNSDTLAFLKAMGNAPSVDELPASQYNRAKIALARKKIKQQEADNAEK